MVQTPKWQIVLVLMVVLFGLGFAAPNILSRQTAETLPGWLPHKQVALGLELRGGSHVLFEADIEGVMDERLEALAESLDRDLRRSAVGHGGLEIRNQELTFRLNDPGAQEQLRGILAKLSGEFRPRISDDGSVHVAFTARALRDLSTNVMEQSAQIARIRLDELGTRDVTVRRLGDRRLVIQVPGEDDPKRIIDILKTKAKLSFRFVMESIVPGRDRVPLRAEVLPSDETGSDGSPISYVVRKRGIVSGENLVDAQATYQDNQPVVSFRFDSLGAQRFCRATQENVGRIFAIVLDDKVISAPVIREPICGGSGIITGRFTAQEVQKLALLLRAGALPATLSDLEWRSVDAGMGADSVRAGGIASMLGLIFVAVFMALSYGLFGVIAGVALIINLVLILAALSGLQATLTLPGIAGIVLTVGMAVDANVLIFEHIREETHLGQGPVNAVERGYRRAMTTILDSNITTLIAALILFVYGTGPVKGFAVTLSIGLVASMFTALMVTRLVLVSWLRRRRPRVLPIGPVSLTPRGAEQYD